MYVGLEIKVRMFQIDPEIMEQLIEKLMKMPNDVWDDTIQKAGQNVDVLEDIEVGNILLTNYK